MELTRFLNFLGPIVCGAAIIGVIIRVMWVNSKRSYLRNNGISSSARVLKINDTMIKYGTGSFAQPLMEIVLEIKDEETNIVRQREVRQAFQVSEIPKVGEWVNILIDPANRDNLIIDSVTPGK